MDIPPNHLPRYLDTLHFPVEVRAATGLFLVREHVSREQLEDLIRLGMVEGKGSATRVRYLRMRVNPAQMKRYQKYLEVRQPLNEGSRTSERDTDEKGNKLKQEWAHIPYRCQHWLDTFLDFVRDERGHSGPTPGGE